MATIYGGASSDDIYFLLITGDREWTDYELVLECVEHVERQCEENRIELHVVHGGARGADSCGDRAANKLQVPCHRYPAPWKRIGRVAGPARNELMPERHPIDGAYVFHDNIAESSGTKDMMKKLIKLGIPYELISHDAS